MSGTLYIVATPIGNLADASPRALEVLAAADLVACEDTRTSRTLFARHGIRARTVALHAHNERAVAARLLAALRSGKNVALVCDAGTPAVSDPGALVVAAAHREGVRVIPIPGPSAATAAYSAAGFPHGRFLFAGFLPSPPGKALDALDVPYPVIVFEAPHRIAATLEALLARFGPEREIAIARELTKKFEEIARMRLADAPAWLAARPERSQGEFVLVLGPGTEQKPAVPVPASETVLALLLESLAPAEAARRAARITGAPRNVLYRAALARARKK